MPTRRRKVTFDIDPMLITKLVALGSALAVGSGFSGYKVAGIEEYRSFRGGFECAVATAKSNRAAGKEKFLPRWRENYFESDCAGLLKDDE